MKVLLACNINPVLQKAVMDLGHYCLSCDIQSPGHSLPFYKGNVLDILNDGWDAMIGFPPCTYLTKAQVHLVNKSEERNYLAWEAAEFFMQLYNCSIPRIALENPPGLLNYFFRPPDQYIQPWYFGDPYRKEIGLWLKNCPPVITSCYNTVRKPVSNRTNGRMSPEEKSRIRSDWSIFPNMCHQIAYQLLGKA